MKIYTILFALFLFLTIPASVFAGDYAELDFIGVSQDGKYMAFVEYGEQDGSGDSYSNIYFVDIEQNKYAAPPVKIMIEYDKGNTENARAKAKRSAAKHIKKLGIIRGNTGKLVVARLLTDSAFSFDVYKDGGKTKTINFRSHVGSLYQIGDYELTLEPFKIEDQKDYVENPVYKFGLELRDINKDTTKTLQKDESLPKSRGLPVNYRIQNIYLYGDKIIVFLNVFTSGFEGPDMRYMVVTGKL